MVQPPDSDKVGARRGGPMATGDGKANAPWLFGNGPLPQTLAAAPVLRRLISAILSAENEDEHLARLIESIATTEAALAADGPSDLAPRVGVDPRPGQRVYVDHGRDIGSFNPCFPEYEIEVQGERASGNVAFGVAFEGPPGYVHGGFLAVFFDCVMQHHNCEYGEAGKTVSLNVEYRRPTPILDTLKFEIERTSDARRITSVARVELNDTVLCRATMEAVAGDRSRLPDVSPRRSRP
jgi:acyl-coenzyme A thioesterase PaaI-like protein